MAAHLHGYVLYAARADPMQPYLSITYKIPAWVLHGYCMASKPVQYPCNGPFSVQLFCTRLIYKEFSFFIPEIPLNNRDKSLIYLHPGGCTT